MRKFKKLGTGLALVASAATLTALAAGPALADPPPNTVPGLTDIVGVGSDTTTPVFSGSPTENVSTSQAFSFDYNATNPANKLYSWDAVDSSGNAGGTIVTKGSSPTDTTCSIKRPNGSSAGIAAMNQTPNLTDAGANCIDFARSSRGPNPGTTDTFIKLASDAIGITYPSAVSPATNPQPTSLTLQNLIDIYNCNVTDWSQVGGSSAPIVPVLPQTGSGTRSTFLAALGITTIKSCVVNGSNASGPIEENTGLSAGNVAQFTGAGSQNDIYPYSIGDWIAQAPAVQGTGAAGTPGGASVGGHASGIWDHGNLQQTQVADDFGTPESAVTTNTTNQPVINPNWLSNLDRTLYDVVRNGCPSTGACFPTAPSYEATALPLIFGSSGWLCSKPGGQSDTVSYGFGLIGNCGSLTPGT